MKNWISILFLSVFVFASTPKTWWHDCHEEHSMHSHNQDETTFQADDCHVCDLSLGDFNFEPKFNFYFSFEPAYFQYVAYEQAVSIDYFQQQLLRGPPFHTI